MFSLVCTMKVQVGYVSGDVFDRFGSHQVSSSVINIQPGQFVACIYDG